MGLNLLIKSYPKITARKKQILTIVFFIVLILKSSRVKKTLGTECTHAHTIYDVQH